MIKQIKLTHQSYYTIKITKIRFHQFHEVEEVLKKHGRELITLDLKNLPVSDDQFKQLMLYCPNLKQLLLDSTDISDEALEHLKEMPLTNIQFSGCPNLADQALKHLEGMPLRIVNFSNCPSFTDKALEYLKEMPLTSIHFTGLDQALIAFRKELNI